MWAIGRVSGFVSMFLLTAALLLGILSRSGRPLLVIPRFSISLLHRNFSLLSAVFLLIHVGTLLLDSYAQLHVIDVVVPFLGSYEPFWQGLGTVAFDIVLALMVTGLLRHRLRTSVFRAIHWLNYAMWPIALAHSIGNGTDGITTWFLISAIVCSVSVLAAVIWRLSARFLEHSLNRQGSMS
ncbi:ferric reductase-like transmembrane domain-containing protein [Arthrobacter psychrolactophilus]